MNVLTIEEAAGQLRVSERTIYDMVRAGKIEAFKVGRVWRIPEEALWDALRYRKEGVKPRRTPKGKSDVARLREEVDARVKAQR